MAHHTPGWNDPPPLSFSQSNQSGKKRTLLNKRVSFPLTPSEAIPPKPSAEVSNNIPNIPPAVVPNCDATNVPCDNVENKGADEPINIPEEDILPFLMASFEEVLAENSESHEKKKIDEIHRRLNVMKDSWDSKISLPVKHKMFKLAEELSQGNAESAMKIQCVLMVDYLREVKQWMVGVKHIIEMKRQTSLPSETFNTFS